MKKINWKVRLNNPVFWVQIITAIIAPILAYLGFNWNDITTWAALGELFTEAVKNPAIVTAVVLSVWNAINDPTTKGLGDSARALTYERPKIDK